MTYTITSFGGFHRATRQSWIDATLVAEEFAVGTTLPATIIDDDDGRRWVKHAGSAPVLAEGPSK